MTKKFTNRNATQYWILIPFSREKLFLEDTIIPRNIPQLAPSIPWTRERLFCCLFIFLVDVFNQAVTQFFNFPGNIGVTCTV